MAIKIIDYTVDISGMTPLTEKDGGSQGDHRVTALKFTLSKELNDAINAQKGDGKAVYRFDIYDGEGGKWSADTTELTGEVVSFELEERHTRYGGKITVYLVLSVLSNDQETEVELYSFPAVLRLKNLPSGVEKTGENYESISSLAEAAKTNSEKAIQSAEVAKINSEIAVQSAESAASSAEKAIESAVLASAEAERAEKTLNCRIPKAVDQETPPFSQTVSIKSNAEYEQINGKWFPKDTDYTYHNIDDGFYNKTSSYAKGFIATRDKTTGNLWTDTPIDDEDCANKKYVDEKTVVDQEFSAQSENAQSGIAIGNVLADLDNRVTEANNYAVRIDMNLTDNYYTKTEVDEKTIVDQTYNSNSLNAQSGKAVAEVANKRMPKVINANEKTAVVTVKGFTGDSMAGTEDSRYSCVVMSETDDLTGDFSIVNKSIPVRDSKGNLQSGDPVKDYDVAPKKYVDDALAQSGGGGSITVDQTYNSNSLNAQSGKAVAQALENMYVGDKVDVINRENATTDFGYTGDTLPFLYAMLKNNVQGLVKTAMGEATPLTIPVRDGNGVVEVGLNIPDEDFFSGPATPLSLLQKRFNDVNLKAVNAQSTANGNKSNLQKKRITSYWIQYSNTGTPTEDREFLLKTSTMYIFIDTSGNNSIRFCNSSNNNLKDTGNSEITNTFNAAIVVIPQGSNISTTTFETSDCIIIGYKKGSSLLNSKLEARQVFSNITSSGDKGSFTVYDYICIDKTNIPENNYIAAWEISLFDDM